MLVARTPLLRAVIIAVLLTALGACSALRIGYSQAPDVAYWWLDGYVDFNGDQTPRVREALKQWFAWHRRTQLPDYAAQLARAQTELAADTTPARACEWQGEVIKRARTAWERALPAAAELVPTLTPQQIQHLERRYAKANEEFRDDFLQPDLRKRAERTLKRTIERAETFYGKLTDAQRTRIADTLPRSPFDPEAWFAERQLRQQSTLAMLRQFNGDGASREPLLAALRGQADQMERSPREPYRRYAEHLNEFNCSFAASLHNSMTPAQRRHAVGKLAGWEGDLRALVAAGG
jgi:hypothetical protein